MKNPNSGQANRDFFNTAKSRGNFTPGSNAGKYFGTDNPRHIRVTAFIAGAIVLWLLPLSILGWLLLRFVEVQT